MDNKRESSLWDQIDRLIFIIAILGLIILIGAYFIVVNVEVIDPALRELILNVITNIVPTFFAIYRSIFGFSQDREATC